MWVARMQNLPQTATTTLLDGGAGERVINETVHLISGFLDDGQPAAMCIYAFIMRKINETIGNPRLRIIFEPKAGECKCGDLLVRYQPPEQDADPALLVLLEFKVRQAQSPPAQQLQNIKHAYLTYPSTQKLLAIEVTGNFTTTLLEV